jgi:hypothetical protein
LYKSKNLENTGETHILIKKLIKKVLEKIFSKTFSGGSVLCFKNNLLFFILSTPYFIYHFAPSIGLVMVRNKIALCVLKIKIKWVQPPINTGLEIIFI